MKPFRITAILAAMAAAPFALAAMQPPADAPAADMQTGQWRSTITFNEFDIPGLPASMLDMVRSQLGRTQTTEYCVTPDDLKRPQADALGGEGAENCEYEDWSYANGRMRAVLVCTVEGAGRARMVMDGSGSPTRYQSTISTEMTGGQMGTIRMRGEVTGEHIGAC